MRADLVRSISLRPGSRASTLAVPALAAAASAVLAAKAPVTSLELMAVVAVLFVALIRPHVTLLLALAPLLFFGRDGGYLGLNTVGVPAADALLATTVAMLVVRRVVTATAYAMPRSITLPLASLAAYSGALVLLSSSGSALDRVREAAPGMYGILAVLAIGLLEDHEFRAVSVWLRRMAGTAAVVWVIRGAWNLAGGVGVVTTSGELRVIGGDAAVYLVVAAFLLRTSPSRVIRRLWWWPLAGVVLAQHRSMFLALLVTGAVALLRTRPEKLWPRIVAAAAVLAVLAPVFSTISITRTAAERFSSLADLSNDPNIGLRYESAESVFDASALEIVFGRGVGLQPTARQPGVDTAGVDDPAVERVDVHNFVLEAVRRGGLISALLTILPIIAALRLALRRNDLVTWPAILTLSVFSLFNVVLEGNYMGIVFWLVIALSGRAQSEAPEPPDAADGLSSGHTSDHAPSASRTLVR